MIFPHVYNAAMAQAGGKPRGAAARIARRLTWDEELRAEAGALLVALMLEPGRSEHVRLFEADTGSTLEEFVDRHRPSVDECSPYRAER